MYQSGIRKILGKIYQGKGPRKYSNYFTRGKFRIVSYDGEHSQCFLISWYSIEPVLKSTR